MGERGKEGGRVVDGERRDEKEWRKRGTPRYINKDHTPKNHKGQKALCLPNTCAVVCAS